VDHLVLWEVPLVHIALLVEAALVRVLVDHLVLWEVPLVHMALLEEAALVRVLVDHPVQQVPLVHMVIQALVLHLA